MSHAAADPEAVLSALGDPMRRRVLEVLGSSGAATATLLAAGLPISRQAVLKHLVVLDRAGLVAHERTGREVRYQARPAGVQAMARWLDALAADWDGRLAALKRKAEAGDS